MTIHQTKPRRSAFSIGSPRGQGSKASRGQRSKLQLRLELIRGQARRELERRAIKQKEEKDG